MRLGQTELNRGLAKGINIYSISQKSERGKPLGSHWGSHDIVQLSGTEL